MIDIIIPVYNTPCNDLIRCFDSIKKQSFAKWKTIIIDDGSNKSTADFLDNYAKNNSNFIIKHIENSGVSAARNVGLKMSHSDYITFCDSDDCFSENYLEDAMEIFERYNVDIVQSSIKELSGKNEIIYSPKENNYLKSNVNLYIDNVISNLPKKNNNLLGNLITDRIWSKIYKKEVVNDIYFDENLYMHEDNLFLIDVLSKIKSIYLTNNSYYAYYQNSYSITHRKYDEKLLEQELHYANQIYKRYNNTRDEILRNSLMIKLINTELIMLNLIRKYDKNSRYTEIIINNMIFNSLFNVNINNYKFDKYIKKIVYRILSSKSKYIRKIFIKLFIKI